MIHVLMRNCRVVYSVPDECSGLSPSLCTVNLRGTKECKEKIKEDVDNTRKKYEHLCTSHANVYVDKIDTVGGYNVFKNPFCYLCITDDPADVKKAECLNARDALPPANPSPSLFDPFVEIIVDDLGNYVSGLERLEGMDSSLLCTSGTTAIAVDLIVGFVSFVVVCYLTGSLDLLILLFE